MSQLSEAGSRICAGGFNEGFADYQRVLTAQQAQFAQQSRYVANKSSVVSSYISLYLALGGGWQVRHETDLLDAETREAMMERTNWGDLLETTEIEVREIGSGQEAR